MTILSIIGNSALLEYDSKTWMPLITFYKSKDIKCYIAEGEKFPRPKK